MKRYSVQFSSVQSLSRVRLFETPWTAAHQGSLSITNFRSLLKLMIIEWTWWWWCPSNHLILCHPLLPLSIFPSIGVFSNESALRIRWPKDWSFSFSISPFNEYSGLSHHNSVCSIIDYRYAQYIAHIVMFSFNEHLLNDCSVLRVKKTKFLSSWNWYSSKRSQITQTNK